MSLSLRATGGASSTCRVKRSPTSPSPKILARLLAECLNFQSRVQRGEAKLGQKRVEIIPPDPLGELGSGWEKVAAGLTAKMGTPASLTVGKT